MKRRIISLLMALVMTLSLVPTAVWAESAAPDQTAAPVVYNGARSGENSNPVAKVGETEHDTLQEILDDCNEVEITLLGNVTEDITVYAETTIHMAGFSITGSIDATDSLTLKNGTVKGQVTVDATKGAFNLTAPADAKAAIDGGLEVKDGSCSVTGAKIGVRGTLYLGGDDMTISGMEKAVELTKAAEPDSKLIYGSADVNGDTSTKATFDTDTSTYKVNGVAAKKLSNQPVGGEPKPADPTLTITPTSLDIAAGETATFTVTYANGTDTLNAYVQGNGLTVDEYFTVTQKDNDDGTYSITVKVDEKTPGGDYTLHVHELGNSFVQAKATINVKTYVAKDSNGKFYTSIEDAIKNAPDGGTVTVIAAANEIFLSDDDIYVENKTGITLDLNGHSLDGHPLNVGGLTPLSEVRTGKLTVIDTEGGNGAVGVAVRNGGTLVFDPKNDHTTLLQLVAYGGTVQLYSGKILRNGWQPYNGVTLANLLPAEGGFAYYREGDNGEKLTIEQATSATCNLVVKSCDHGGASGFDSSELTCPGCGAPAVAYTELDLPESEGNAWRKFADLQTALDADRDGGSVVGLLADVSGDYTIDGSTITGMNLFGHSINGTVYVTGDGGEETTFSNSKDDGSIEKVIASANAKLAVSGAAAIIDTLQLVDGATWVNIVNLFRNPGYKVYTNYPDLSTYKWYAPEEVEGTVLNNVSIKSLPITSSNLYFKVNGKNVTSVERGTTVQLLAYCNTADAEVYIYTGVPAGDGTFTYSKKKADYKKIGSSWYYVVDLDANTIGTYDIYFTASKDGYSVTSAHKNLSVSLPNLSNATITFTNKNQSAYDPSGTTSVPPYTVTYNGVTLKEGVDYTVVSGDTHSRIGYTSLKIEAAKGSEYSGTKSARWRVVAHKVDVVVNGDVIKTYDGTTDLPADAKISLVSVDDRYWGTNQPALVKGTDYTLENARYDSADASETEKKISFTAKLLDSKYTFGTSTQKIVQIDGATLKDQTFKINPATIDLSQNEFTQVIYNDLAKTYEIDLKPMLDAILSKQKPAGVEYGSIEYQSHSYYFTDNAYLDGNDGVSVSNNGILTLCIVSAHSTAANNEIGTVKVNVNTTNYGLFQLPIKVKVGEKITPVPAEGFTVSASDITYGDALNKSTLTVEGKMICPRTKAEIPGTFAWTDGTVKPNAGIPDAEWTFTPAEGYEAYTPATGTVTVKVARKNIKDAKVTLKQSSYEYSGSHITPDIESVILDGVTLACSSPMMEKDYYYSSSSGTDVGTYKFTVHGLNNYIGDVTVNWYITPREVTPTITVASCSYTGDALEPDVTLTDDLGNTIDSKEYEVSYSNNTNAGKGRVTIKDVEGGNYVIKESSQDFLIDKANAPTNIQNGTLDVINGTTLTYTYDFSKLLPELTKGEYGTVSYKRVSVTGLQNGYDVVGTARVDETTGALTLQLSSVGSVGQLPPGSAAGNVNIYVYTTNFQPFVLTLDLNPIDQIKPVADGDITATDITYGDKLSQSIISGKMKDPDTGKEVNGTFAWKDGTVTPNAGMPDAEWVFTPDSPKYAAVTGKVTITVKKATLTGVSVKQKGTLTYNGSEQVAVVEITGVEGLEGITFFYAASQTADRNTEVPAFTDAGTYKVFYYAESNNYDIPSGTFTVTIDPLPISLLSVERISKSYDGTANVTLTASRLTFFSKAASRSGIILPDTALTFSDAQFTMKQADESYLPSPEAGNGKALSFTMTLANNNYVFEGKPEGTKTVSDTFATNDTTRFTITKAAAPAPQAGALTVTNDLARTYTVNLAALLTAPDSPCRYGTITYGTPTVRLKEGYYTSGAKVENGTLTLPIQAVESSDVGEIGTVTVVVTTDNYEDVTLTVNVSTVNKIVPTGTPILSKSTITYGDELNSITLSGKLRDETNSVDVAGTFRWKDGTIKPNANDSYEAEWTFTPDEPEYAAATGKVSVKVNKAPLTITANNASVTYGSAVPSFSVTYDGFVNSEDNRVLSGALAFDCAYTAASNVGSYSITPSGLTSNNYAITFKPGTLTVTTATATVTAPTAKTLTYTGDEQALVNEGSTTGGTMLYSLTENGTYSDAIPTGTNAGSYTVWYKVDGGGNYENVAPAKLDVTIRKADLTNISVAQSGTLTYNGHKQTATVDAKATAAGSQSVTFTYCAEENGTYNTAVPAFTGKGTYTVYYKASAANHNDAFGQFTVKIDPLNISGAVIALAAAELTYNGHEQSPAITSVTVNGLTLTAGSDYTITGNTGKDAKGYTLTITGKGNFTGTATANWAITPKDITGATVTLGAGLTYNGQEQTQTVASVTTPDGLHVTYDVSGNTGTDAKDYTLTVTGKGNFQGKVTQAFTIAQLDIASATVTLGDALIYNGQEQTQTVASVKVGELTVPADTYTVTHNTGKEAGEYALTVTVNSGNFTGKTTWKFPVNKAFAADQSTDLTVVNNAVKDYTVDLSALLPALKVLERYGDISYGRPEFTTSGLAEGESYTVQTSVDDRGLLTVKVLSTSGSHEGPIGTVSVVVTTDNFADFTLTVNVSAANKIIPTGGPTLSRDWLRYGETIGAIRLSGSMKDGDANVPGIFQWVTPNVIPGTETVTAEWVFIPTDTDRYTTVSGSVTLTVKDIPEDIHVVTGQVIYVQGDGSTVGPVSGADVTIVRGTKTLSRTTTDADGNFSLAGVPSGEYNIVVKVNTNPAKTVTAKLVLTTEDKDVQMSAIKVRTEDINSKLDVSKSPFDIVVGGLDRLAESVFDNDNTATSVTASMTIDQPATDGNDPHQKAIREKAGGKTLDLLNLALNVQGSDQQSHDTLELIIPYDTSRSGIKMYRSLLDANGKVIAEELADSAVKIDKQSGCIRLTIPADQLGLYAIGYTPASTGGGGSSGVKKDDTVKSAGTGDMGLLPYAVMALGACTGTVVLRFRRKRED